MSNQVPTFTSNNIRDCILLPPLVLAASCYLLKALDCNFAKCSPALNYNNQCTAALNYNKCTSLQLTFSSSLLFNWWSIWIHLKPSSETFLPICSSIFLPFLFFSFLLNLSHLSPSFTVVPPGGGETLKHSQRKSLWGFFSRSQCLPAKNSFEVHSAFKGSAENFSWRDAMTWAEAKINTGASPHHSSVTMRLWERKKWFAPPFRICRVTKVNWGS